MALKACAQCPAICECARYAAEHALINGYPLQGIWGGINRSKGKNYRNNEKEMQEDYIRQAKELLALARKAVNE